MTGTKYKRKSDGYILEIVSIDKGGEHERSIRTVTCNEYNPKKSLTKPIGRVYPSLEMLSDPSKYEVMA